MGARATDGAQWPTEEQNKNSSWFLRTRKQTKLRSTLPVWLPALDEHFEELFLLRAARPWCRTSDPTRGGGGHPGRLGPCTLQDADTSCAQQERWEQHPERGLPQATLYLPGVSASTRDMASSRHKPCSSPPAVTRFPGTDGQNQRRRPPSYS